MKPFSFRTAQLQGGANASPTDPSLPIPKEIPWQLASTTQMLVPEPLGPDTATISLFTFVPHIDTLDKDYPNDQLVYLKFAVSIAPTSLFIPKDTSPEHLLFDKAWPIWRVIFDIKVTPNPAVMGGMRPYFMAASPIRRTMLETGVVGKQEFEGESNALAIGKSGSQVHRVLQRLHCSNYRQYERKLLWPSRNWLQRQHNLSHRGPQCHASGG